ncbi:MAG: hypothetical protein DRP58_00685 [Spirochaetes bacterium]|nr:MAG: hypothetical protein DRP58_00685 [Spirochaetota bacterium]
MFRICIIVLSLFIVTLAAVAPTKAYWLDPPKPEPFTMHGARENAPITKNGILTVQDNFGTFTRQDASTPMLLPDSDYFIPADRINTNLPIFGIFSHPAQPAGDPIANLIYADLKLKKLTEQYTKLQEKAKKLLSSHYNTISDNMMKNTDIISIEQESYQISTQVSAIYTTGITAKVSEINKMDNSQERHKAITLSNNQKNYHEKQLQIGTTASKNIARYTNDKPTPTTLPEKKDYNKTFKNPNKFILFFLSLPTNLFKYLMSNKIEALFIIFFIIITISIIFGYLT